MRKHDQRGTNPAIRDCGQTITEKAESIYGDYAYPTNLQVVITMKANELPNITVNREFFSDIMVERNGGHIKQAALSHL